MSADDIANEAIVIDSLGQPLSLSIENVVGGGGQRRVSVFCPFWIINLTEHSLKYRHDASSSFVSGTFNQALSEFPKLVERSNVNPNPLESKVESQSSTKMPKPNSVASKKGTIFSGTKGALARTEYALSLEECSLLMANEYSLEAMTSLGFMFNFHELPHISQRKICVQLADADYCSDWSGGISLESVGVTQTVGMVSSLYKHFRFKKNAKTYIIYPSSRF